MNDRFKFRAWDERTKTCFNNAMIETLAPISTWVKNGWVVEQCTGLKDKNGRLIYEGDIMKLDSEQPGIHIAKVIYRNGCFGLSAKKWVSPFNFLQPRRWKKIGNIHENPELLEVEK